MDMQTISLTSIAGLTAAVIFVVGALKKYWPKVVEKPELATLVVTALLSYVARSKDLVFDNMPWQQMIIPVIGVAIAAGASYDYLVKPTVDAVKDQTAPKPEAK